VSRFHRLTVASVARETRDAVVVALDVPPGLRDAFTWRAGQHLTVKATVDGEDLRRSYSICSAEGERLRIAVKRAPGGLFSTWANAALRPGDTLEVTPPMGHFGVAIDPHAAHRYVGFAAGSGITPLVSIVRSVLVAEPRSRFTLFYGNRASGSVMFRDELAALKDRFLDRFGLVHVLSREAQDVELLHGRIDAARTGALLDRFAPPGVPDGVFLCGPDGMMAAVSATLAARGVPGSRIRIERFAASIPQHTHVARPLAEADARDCAVTVIQDGVRRSYTLAIGDDNLLDAGLRAGVELPYSCKGGVCSTCRCRLLEGEVDMDVNFALEDYELERGFILACQSYPVTPAIVVDFDQTGNG
jgi:ring-1,2-phenylacetyl-CoA epoxidase subunit PaaE